jgi:hypothetical protein
VLLKNISAHLRSILLIGRIRQRVLRTSVWGSGSVLQAFLFLGF